MNTKSLRITAFKCTRCPRVYRDVKEAILCCACSSCGEKFAHENSYIEATSREGIAPLTPMAIKLSGAAYRKLRLFRVPSEGTLVPPTEAEWKEVLAFWPQLRRVAGRRAIDPSWFDDLLQVGAIAAARSLRSCAASDAPTRRAYALYAAAGRMLDYLHRFRSAVSLPGRASTAIVEQLYAETESVPPREPEPSVVAAFHRLKPRYAEVLALRLQGFSLAETGIKMGLGRQGVWALEQAAVASLCRKLRVTTRKG